MNSQVANYRKIAQNFKTFENSTKKISEFISDKKPKVEETYNYIKETEKNVNKSYTEVCQLLKKATTESENITKLNEKSNESFLDIVSKKNDSNHLLFKIKEIYEIAAETGLSGEFENRRNKLKLEVVKWEKRLLIVSSVLLTCLIGLFIFQLYLYDWKIASNNFDTNFYVRFLILSPIVYYLYFCSSQHAKIMKLYDKYSFKTTMAMSIKAHIELLLSTENFQTDERINKILDFIILAFEKIYKEPYTDDDFKLKLKLANIELDIENKILEKLTKIGKKE